MRCRENPVFDYAVLVLTQNNKRDIGTVTGANGWRINLPRSDRHVRIIGYPRGATRPWISETDTVTIRVNGHRYRRGSTPGFSDGTSGGPWFYSFNGHTRLGILLGNIGGYQHGGATDSPSYSDYWTSDFAEVMASAVKIEG